MSRWPPDITYTALNNDWTVTVKWQVDSFLHGDSPDRVDVRVNGQDYPNHSDSDVTIDANTVRGSGAFIVIEIDYVWEGDPAPRQSSCVLPLPAGGVTAPGTPERPEISVKHRLPKTLRNPNSITVSWSSYSITHADLYWGDQGAPNRHIGLKVTAQHYGGDVTTDVPLRSGRMYEFKIVVKNTLKGWGPYSAETVVRSASNYQSVREFLTASGLHGPSLRSALGIVGLVSLRDLLGD
jgi:hypothetical protein